MKSQIGAEQKIIQEFNTKKCTKIVIWTVSYYRCYFPKDSGRDICDGVHWGQNILSNLQKSN